MNIETQAAELVQLDDSPHPDVTAALNDYAARFRAHYNSLALRSSTTGRARFSRCQWIAGEPSADDACKCNAPTVNGVYCAHHLERSVRREGPGEAAKVAA